MRIIQRRARLIFIGPDKNQDFVSNFLDFKQESRKVKQQFLISSGSQDLKFGKRIKIQARIEMITFYVTLKACIF